MHAAGLPGVARNTVSADIWGARAGQITQEHGHQMFRLTAAKLEDEVLLWKGVLPLTDGPRSCDISAIARICMYLGRTGLSVLGRKHSLVPASICRLERPTTRSCGAMPLTMTGNVEVMAASTADRPAVFAGSTR